MQQQYEKSQKREINMSTEFKYDHDLSREINFRRWYEANTLEKEGYGMKPYTLTEGRNVFNELYDLFEKIPHKK
jgi:hypothetical protein